MRYKALSPPPAAEGRLRDDRQLARGALHAFCCSLPSPFEGLWPQIAFGDALGEPERTSTGGITATGRSPHVPTGGTCDLRVRVGQAGKDSVTSLGLPVRSLAYLDTKLKQPQGSGQAVPRRPRITSARPRPASGARPPSPGSHLGGEQREPEATHTLSSAKLRDCEVD